uniref:UBX domain-containing protein n=1 Tax=Panagrellus redivivus TaxID=6233 RepID=A0A7E4V6F7_PANRE
MLSQAVTAYDAVKGRLTAEAHERLERERLRNEQQTAYEIGKEQDRIKFEARAKLLREQREAEEALAKEKQARIEKEAADKILQQELAATMPEEPDAGAVGTIMIKLRFPDNHQEVRRFLRKGSLKLLSHFAGSRGYLAADYRIFTSDFPRKNVTTLNAESTFDELGWSPREQVIVEEI